MLQLQQVCNVLCKLGCIIPSPMSLTVSYGHYLHYKAKLVFCCHTICFVGSPISINDVEMLAVAASNRKHFNYHASYS